MRAVLSINTKVVYAVIAVAAVILLCILGYVLLLRLSNRLFHKIFDRPAPMPKADRSPRYIPQDTPSGRARNWFYTKRREYLNVVIKSYDGTRLFAYYRRSSDPSCRNTVILLHGYNEHPSEMAPYAKMFMRNIQCNVLIPHSRAHCMSYGKYCTYGIYETEDLNSWIRFAVKQGGPDTRVYLMGRSMGAVSALICAGQPTVSPNVVGVVADCPYASLEEVLLRIGKKRYGLDLSFLLRKVNNLVRTNLEFDMSICNASSFASNIQVPVLLYEGTEDDVAEPDGVRDIYNNIQSQKRMVMINEAGHCGCYNQDPEDYEKELRKFIETCVMRLVKMGRM